MDVERLCVVVDPDRRFERFKRFKCIPLSFKNTITKPTESSYLS